MRLNRYMYNVIKVSNVSYVVILTAAYQLRAVILPFALPPVSHCGSSGQNGISSVIACLSLSNVHCHRICIHFVFQVTPKPEVQWR